MTVTFKKLGNFGALGNQLFQIVGTISVADAHGDRASFPPWAYEKCFRVPHRLFDDAEGTDMGEQYFQDLVYFKGLESTIRDYFGPSIPMMEDISARYGDILETPTTAVHVRRANNMNLPMHHPVCSLEYFEEALDLVRDEQVMVFSDDLAWCKQQSIFKDAAFAEGNDPNIDVSLLTNGWPLALTSVAMDLHTMAMCDSHIISNSTFSWWGAWLANKEKVIFPRPWYGPAIDIDVEKTMIPNNWTPLERKI